MASDIVSLQINARTPVRVPAGSSLLAALRALGVFVPSACGGHGICGLCRVKVVEGAGAPSPREQALLGDADRAAGLRLACQVPVERDLRIELPEDWFQAREFKAVVLGLRALTPDIREVRLKLVEPPAIEFKAGQYIQLRIPPGGDLRRPAYRAYSIASPPSHPGAIELEVKRVLNGAGSAYVFERLQPGARVLFNGPHGDFVLRPDARDLLFVAGGSGMAPIKAMLLDLLEHPPRRSLRYVFGARTRADLFLLDVMAMLEARLPDFRFIPTVLRPDSGEAWTGATGLVTDTLDALLGEGAERRTDAYLCGSPAMVAACVKHLRTKCFEDDRIFYDKFA